MVKTRSPHLAVGLLVVLGLLVLAGCGGLPTQTTTPTRTSTHPSGTSTPAAQPSPGITRVPYPWPMQATTTSFGTTIYRPSDPAVRKEMQADFLTFWVWSGHAKPPEVLHFVPDATQIPRLATADDAGQLQTYVQQVETSGQLVTYTGKQFIQNIKSCTRDGLQCTNLYAFGVTVKAVYSTRTGNVISKTTAPNFFATVSILQVYNRSLQVWQIGSVQVNEISG